jgi:hypothetical protein
LGLQALGHPKDRRWLPGRSAASAGQSLVEFALILPIMLVLFAGIADLGRVFAAGVVLEAAARNAAEIAANAYLSDPPGTGGLEAPVTGATSGEYSAYHGAAATAVCQEVRSLPNTKGSGVDCTSMPLISVCVHDGADPRCGAEAFGAPVPTECTQTSAASTNSQAGGGATRWVEVRLCYQFTAILDMPFFSFDTIWLERTRSFVIPCYFVLGTGDCG